MWIWLILVPVGLILLFLLVCFISGLITYIPMPVKKAVLEKEIEFIIDLSEGRHPEITDSDSTDLAFVQRIWDKELERTRRECLKVGEQHRSLDQLLYCDSDGVVKLKKILEELRQLGTDDS